MALMMEARRIFQTWAPHGAGSCEQHGAHRNFPGRCRQGCLPNYRQEEPTMFTKTFLTRILTSIVLSLGWLVVVAQVSGATPVSGC